MSPEERAYRAALEATWIAGDAISLAYQWDEQAYQETIEERRRLSILAMDALDAMLVAEGLLPEDAGKLDSPADLRFRAVMQAVIADMQAKREAFALAPVDHPREARAFTCPCGLSLHWRKHSRVSRDSQEWLVITCACGRLHRQPQPDYLKIRPELFNPQH